MTRIGISKRLWAMLSYLGILVIFPLIHGLNDPFVRFHAKQGVALLLVNIIFPLLAALLINETPTLVGQVIVLAWLFFTLFGLTTAALGKKLPIPLIGKLAGKIKL